MNIEGNKIIFDYDVSSFNFYDIFKQYLSIFGIDNLENFHSDCSQTLLSNEIVTVENDQLTPVYKILYEIDEGYYLTKSYNPGKFLSTYKDFVYYLSSTIFKEELVYQRRPTLRIHFPENKAVGGFHKDREYNHPIEEINIWVPVTSAFNTNTIWIESEFDKEDYSPMNLNFGQGLIFDSGLNHGNKVNVENLTRLSFDFRVIPLSKWKEIEGRKPNFSTDQHLKFVLNDYYDVTT
jgi:hypothetical protein